MKPQTLLQPGKRDNSIDRVAGVMILYVIFGHMLNWSVGWCETRATLEKIIPYFMPWFFFKSGMFFKSGVETAEVARKGWKKLIVPFIFFSVLGIILQCIKWHIQGTLSLEYAWNFEVRRIFLFGSFEGANPLWFLVSLFLVKVIYNYLRNHNISTGVILGCCLTFLMANWLLKVEVGGKESPLYTLLSYPRYLYNVPCGMFFYCMGHLLKEKQYDWKVWVPCLLVFVAISFFRKNGSRISFMHNDPGGNCDYALFLAAALGQCVAINAIFKYFTMLCNKVTDFSILAYFGRNSIAVYTMHWPIMMIVWMFMVGSGAMPDNNIPEIKNAVRSDPELCAQMWMEVIWYASICLTLIPALCELISRSKKFKWILGR